MLENREGKKMPFKGRDHHAAAFSMWMAGGGIKGGTSYGETDEIGYDIVSGKTESFDIQATILHQLGFDHENLRMNRRAAFPFNRCAESDSDILA
jgi:hypothetical protein